MSTTAMMIRPMRGHETMARSLPVTRDSWPPRAAGSRCLLLSLHR